MATYKKYHGISLADNSVIENLHIERLASDPTLLEAGRIWYNTTTKQLKTSVRDGDNNLVVKTYVDTDTFAHWQQGIIMKEAVKVATITAISDPFVSGIPGTIDGVTLTANDRVLIKDASNPIDNGIVYVSSPIGEASTGNEIKLMPFGSNYDPVVITRSVSSTNPSDMTLVFAEGTGTETCTTVGNVTTLTLKKSTNKKSCLLSDNDGSNIKISEKNPFQINCTYGSHITYTKGTGNNVPFAVTINTSNTNLYFKINSDVIVNITLPTNSSGDLFKTTAEIVSLLNADVNFSKIFVAEVNVGASNIFSYSYTTNFVRLYDDFKKSAKYDTTASTVMTLLNNSGHWTAKMNGNTTVIPRWQSIISNDNFNVIGGTWDGTEFTSVTGSVTLNCKYDYLTSIFKSGIPIGGSFNCSPLIFNPNKIKFSSSSPVGIVIIRGDNDDSGQTLYSGDTISGQEIALTYKDEVFTGISFSENAQSITDVQVYVGDDWRIFDSSLMYSTASTVTPQWRSIMSRDSFHTTDMNLTYDENNNTMITTGTAQLNFVKNANKVNYSNLTSDDNYNYRPIKMKISFIGTISDFQINNSVTNIGSGVITSGDEITISSFIPNINDIINLTWYTESTTATISDIQVYDGTTGITPNNIGKLGLPSNYSVVRTTDADENTSPSELRAGATVFVTNGTTNGQIQFTLVTSGDIIPGTTAQTWTATNTSVTNTLKTKINAQRFRYTSSTPATSHVITHNFNSNYLDVKYMVYDTSKSKWTNDGALLQYDTINQLTITLTESSNVIVTIQKLDDLS